MENNETVRKIEKLMKERNWTLYHLSVESDLPYSSIENLFRRNTEPTLPTLRSLCRGFGVSMSEFFSDEPAPLRIDYTMEEQNLIIEYRSLRRTDRRLVRTYVAGLGKKLPEITAEDTEKTAADE